MENNLYKIPACNLDELDRRIAKINKKAAKLGAAPVVTKYIGMQLVPYTEEGRTYTRRYFEFEITGVAPKLPGWTFLGTLQHSDVGNILRAVPGETLPEAYRTIAPLCDHCKTRRRRKDTYVVRNDDGSIKQVGHNCVADYLGGVSPEAVAWSATIIKELQELTGGGGFEGKAEKDLALDFLTYAAQCVLDKGWVSRGASKTYAEKSGGPGLETTADRTWMYLHPTKEMIKRGDVLTISDRAKELAADAVEYAKTIEPKSDYEWNLKIASQAEFVTSRDSGILASLIPAYQKAMGKLEARARKIDALRGSKHFGTIGVRAEFTVLIDGEHTFDSNFNPDGASLYRMRDLVGNVCTWWSSPGKLEVGKTYKIKATVKKHDMWNGIAQTVLTRCKMMEEIKGAAV